MSDILGLVERFKNYREGEIPDIEQYGKDIDEAVVRLEQLALLMKCRTREEIEAENRKRRERELKQGISMKWTENLTAEERTIINMISGAMNLPELNEYESMRAFLYAVYSRIVEARSLISQGVSALSGDKQGN